MNFKSCLLVSIDTLRADYSIELEEWFDVIFRKHHSLATYTLPGHANLLTGRIDHFIPDPSENVSHCIFKNKMIKPEMLFTRFFKKAGWKTRAMTGGGWVRNGFFGHYFDSFDEKYKMTEEIPLEKEFVFLHTYSLHNYFREANFLYSDLLYAARDKKIKQENIDDLHGAYARDFLKTKARFQWLARIPSDCLVVLTSDHGECFGEEQYSFTHGATARYNPEVFHIPLMFKTNAKKKRWIHDKTESVDVAPTILKLLGIEFDKDAFQGKALL